MTTAKYIRWIVWLTYLLAWTWALLVPNPAELAETWIRPEPSRTPSEWRLRDQLSSVVLSANFPKLLHVVAYAIFAILSGWLRSPQWYRVPLLLILSVHALGTEFAQSFEPTRHASWRDVGLDHLGIGLGLLLSWKWWRFTSPHTG
jgi:VanZ family protein